MRPFFFILYSMHFLSSFGATLHVGDNQTFKLLPQATSIAVAGDVIICHDAVMQGGMAIANLKGNANNWITIKAEEGKTITIQGGSNSIQFSDCEYLHFEGFTIQGQTGNGVNIDDGGTFETPTHHIRIVNCTFRDINATGNNDLLKLSGLDDFEIRQCDFLNGATGGSGIDMVGCHRGLIEENNFKNLGSNSIQAKGGTALLMIFRNTFENGGARSLNLGGSTGLQFFRPLDATTEAQDIKVIGNFFQGSEAPIAYVGSRNVEVSNNTILFPGKWVVRILQETVDPTRFLPCGENSFFNNIIVVNNNVNTEVNIGPNTAPETFDFNKNIWYKTTNQNWSGPNLPGNVVDQMVLNPALVSNTSYELMPTSPAIGAGLPYNTYYKDIDGNLFNNPPSIGAFESNPLVVEVNDVVDKNFSVYPNPFHHFITLDFGESSEKTISLYDIKGILLHKLVSTEAKVSIENVWVKEHTQIIIQIKTDKGIFSKLMHQY